MIAATLAPIAGGTRHWRTAAACAGQDPELFFPYSARTLDCLLQIAQALGICRCCPVRPECLTAALGRDPGDRCSQVLGGCWFDDRGEPWNTPPPTPPDAMASHAAGPRAHAAESALAALKADTIEAAR